MSSKSLFFLQDLTVHRAEVHSKLVGIMRERLNASLKGLPTSADAWAGGKAPAPGAPPPQASPFAASNAKQLRILSQVPLQLATRRAKSLLNTCLYIRKAMRQLCMELSSNQTLTVSIQMCCLCLLGFCGRSFCPHAATQPALFTRLPM